MVRILREAGQAPVTEVAKKHGVAEQTLYAWRKRFGSMSVDEARRLKQLEAENGRLKRLVAVRDLEIQVMKEIAVKNGERARAATTGGVSRKRGLSCRRACWLLRVARSSLRYESRKEKADGPVRQKMAELAAQYLGTATAACRFSSLARATP